MPEQEAAPPPLGRRTGGIAAGILLGGALLLLPAPAGMPAPAWRVAAVAVLMATWWVSEAIPIAATALVPLALFPSLDVAPLAEVARPYANPLVFLMLGGFLLGLAMQRSGLHRRLALAVLRMTGRRAENLVGGFMAATATLSMWMSNTATSAMMVPIGLSVVRLMREGGEDDVHLARALLLGIAYGANVGGMGTLIGTPPNAVLAAFMSDAYGIEIGFARWMLVGLPVALVLLLVAWLLLTRVAFRIAGRELEGVAIRLGRARIELGAPSARERRFAVILGLAGLAWLTRPLLEAALPDLVLSDAGIAIMAALLLFLVPDGTAEAGPVLEWEATRELPWNILLLIGGGLSLGSAIESTGLAAWIGDALAALAVWPVPFTVAAVSVLALLLSHVMSNTATAAALVPLVASLASSLGEPPLRLALPAVLACSCAFMLPVATPPNAIVAGTGLVPTPVMARAGAIISVAAVLVILSAVYALPAAAIVGG